MTKTKILNWTVFGLLVANVIFLCVFAWFDSPATRDWSTAYNQMMLAGAAVGSGGGMAAAIEPKGIES